MPQLYITDDGKLVANDYRSLHKAVLVTLANNNRSLTVYMLVKEIRESYIEFKYLKERSFTNTIFELIKAKLVELRG